MDLSKAPGSASAALPVAIPGADMASTQCLEAHSDRPHLPPCSSSRGRVPPTTGLFLCFRNRIDLAGGHLLQISDDLAHFLHAIELIDGGNRTGVETAGHRREGTEDLSLRLGGDLGDLSGFDK